MIFSVFVHPQAIIALQVILKPCIFLTKTINGCEPKDYWNRGQMPPPSPARY